MPTLEEIRHSTAHILAAAVTKMWPDAKLGIGPVIDDGFYYDFDLKYKLSPEDFQKIEQTMREIINKKLDFQKKLITAAEAKKEFKNDPYKLELIKEFEKEGKQLSFYMTGEFVDLCKGPHVQNTKELGAFKLLKVSGSYWRGNSENAPMQRIYGTAFTTKKEVEDYLLMLEEAKKRDHKVLGPQLELFQFLEESPGSPFFLPKGTIIYNELLKFIREEYNKRGYSEVITPLIYDKSLWETSGHWEHYKEDMFVLKADNREFGLKPMNCPSHCLIYKTSLKSYKDLPLRIADFAPLHRNELKGVLAGLTRVRKFSQDDSHIFTTEEKLEEEMNNLIDFFKFVYEKTFHFKYEVGLGTRPKEKLGSEELWNKAESVLSSVLEKNKIAFKINKGDGAFYGPKIDFRVKDSLNREWQLATIQLDFNLPERFDLTYEGSDGKKHRPIMIHRAILGSLERFIGILVEEYVGKFPVWLSPTQVVLMTIADKHNNYTQRLAEELKSNGVRVITDLRNESIGKKVRDNQSQKIPYMITIGDKEMETNNLSIRTRDNKVMNLKKEDFIKQVVKEINERNN
jgi:threonyl-tRNA synthetase